MRPLQVCASAPALCRSAPAMTLPARRLFRGLLQGFHALAAPAADGATLQHLLDREDLLSQYGRSGSARMGWDSKGPACAAPGDCSGVAGELEAALAASEPARRELARCAERGRERGRPPPPPRQDAEPAGDAGREDPSSSLLWMSSTMLATDTCPQGHGLGRRHVGSIWAGAAGLTLPWMPACANRLICAHTSAGWGPWGRYRFKCAPGKASTKPEVLRCRDPLL